MAQARCRTITLRAFRRMDSLSGEMRVVGGSRTRRGVRRPGRRASCKSQEWRAGSDAGRGTAAGGSAHTSAAHAARRDTDAELAKPKAEEAERAPNKKKSKKAQGGGGNGKGGGPIESLWEERAHLNGGEVLPEDGAGFVDKVNELIDLVRYTELMLRGVDEKSSKSLLGQLLDIRYGKNARLAVTREDEPDKLTWNLPR